jgi:vitamin B12 transporter
LTLRLTDATADFDDNFPAPTFALSDSPAKSRNKTAVAGLTIAAPLSARWDHRLVIGWSRDHGATSGAAFGDTDLDAQSRQVDWQHTLGVGADNLVTVGYEYQNRLADITGAGEHRLGTNAFYVQDQLAVFDPLFITIGGRTDDNNRFGHHNTYKAGASLKLPSWRSRVFGNYATGFRGPTLNDLYYPGFSNPNLLPEESRGYETGVSIDMVPNVLTTGATYFRTRYENMIAADSLFVPQNINTAESQGVEFTGELRGPHTRMQGTYTYTSTHDGSTNDLLLRRPRNKAGVALIVEPDSTSSVRLDGRYVGKRLDFGTTVDPYFVVSLAATERTRPNLEWFLRMENMFNQDYEEVAGYGTPGRSVYVGLTAKF